MTEIKIQITHRPNDTMEIKTCTLGEPACNCELVVGLKMLEGVKELARTTSEYCQKADVGSLAHLLHSAVKPSKN